jgi:hypothetical protein
VANFFSWNNIFYTKLLLLLFLTQSFFPQNFFPQNSKNSWPKKKKKQQSHNSDQII